MVLIRNWNHFNWFDFDSKFKNRQFLNQNHVSIPKLESEPSEFGVMPLQMMTPPSNSIIKDKRNILIYI